MVGSSDVCRSTVSDPSTGKVEKWGLDDPFHFLQLEAMVPNLVPFGMGSGPAAAYNVMDVSLSYGMIGGGGFPGGRPYYRATNEVRGRYLGNTDSSSIDMSPETPKIPELVDSICSVWIAKSSSVPSMTQHMVGMMTGSSLGVLTSYAVSHDSTGPRYKAGEMTARWVLSPGVPIISIKVDESYSYRRKTLGRIWGCAVNALGECFFLTTTPQPPAESIRRSLGATNAAWVAGRSVYWELIESTRRQAQSDEMDPNAVRGDYSPRSSCDDMCLSKEQIIAEARKIEQFLRYEPGHFRRVCQNWDMRRRVEVDFAEEIVLIIRCGRDTDEPAEILRLARNAIPVTAAGSASGGGPAIMASIARPSVFESGSRTPVSRSPTPSTLPSRLDSDTSTPLCETAEWQTTRLSLKKLRKAGITVTAIDSSMYALLAPFEDPLSDDVQSVKSGLASPNTQQNTGEIPGRGARLFGVGTDQGRILLWNLRDMSKNALDPVCVIQTESPRVTGLAISALYVVHGGSDCLVQAWDYLMSSSEPIRTLSARAPRYVLNATATLQRRLSDYASCLSIFIDPDPTSLRGMFCFGPYVRYWSYSSTVQTAGGKRRLRHSDIHGRLASRRQSDAVLRHIAAEESELRQEQQQQAREDTRLRDRFGVGLGGLTEEEAATYGQMISEEAFLLDEQRRPSASDTGSATDIGESNSAWGSLDTGTPDLGLSGQSPAVRISRATTPATADDDFEQQTQRALRLSLVDGDDDMGQSPPGGTSTGFEFYVKYKVGKGKRSAPTSHKSSEARTPLLQGGEASVQLWRSSPSPRVGEETDDDLALALRLSVAEEEQRQQTQAAAPTFDDDAFPPLGAVGKGKGVARY